MKILPTIITSNGSEWLSKIEEVKKLKLKEVSFFLTGLDQEQRKQFYNLLKDTSVKSAPLVHIRNDMEIWELDYIVKTYGTKIFNTHTGREYPHLHDYGKYKKLIYIENTHKPFDEKEIKEFAGICLDFSHLENARLLHQDVYQHNISVIENARIGCCHISAVKPNIFSNERGIVKIVSHNLDDLSEFDYLKGYPLKYFAPLIAIELKNTIEEHLKAKEYISELIKEKTKTAF